jgi:DNA-binding response OmpR family regulator
MPDTDGFDLVPKIRNIPAFAYTPILFFSGVGTTANVAVALSLGAEDFISKPIDPKSFLPRIEAKIKNYLFLRRLRENESE